MQAHIGGLTSDGKGVVKACGKTVFVRDALPGEDVEIQRVKRRRNFDEARTLWVLTASASRVEPRCEVFGVCGGCSLQHLKHSEQVRHKHDVLNENLRRIAGVEADTMAEPLTGPVWNYRRKARLGVKFVTKKDRVLVGFRERLKPYITDMRVCPILEAQAAELPGKLADLISGLSIRSQLPQVELAVADNATALVLRVLESPSGDDLRKLRGFAATNRLKIFLQPGGLDSVQALEAFPATSPGVAGDPLYYRLDKNRLELSFTPTDFVQINRSLNEELVALAIRLLDLGDTDRVLDLYCGIGNFSLPIARRAGAVLGVDGAPALIERARQNAIANGIDNAQFAAADLEKLTGDESWLHDSWDLVVLDPARAGAAAVVACLGKIAPRRIVYVSCHPGTLARDIGELVRAHGYRLCYAGIIDMFAHTAHVESIAMLERSSVADQ